MFTPCAIAIVNTANSPLLIRTTFDEVDREEATRLIYLLHASLDIVEEKSEQPTSRDNFLGSLYQCEQYKIYGLMSTTKVKILLMISLKTNYGLLPRENDIRQMLKNVHRAYVDATAMNPFYKPNEPVNSKRLNAYLDTIFNPITGNPQAQQQQQQPPPPPPPLPLSVPSVGQGASDDAPTSIISTSSNPAIQTV